MRARLGRPRPHPAGGGARARRGPGRAVRPRPRRPARPGAWPLHVASQGDTLRLDFAATGLKPESIRNAAYFPYAETAIDNAAAQPMSIDGTGLHLTLARGSPTDAAPDTLPGVLTYDAVSACRDRAASPSRTATSRHSAAAAAPVRPHPCRSPRRSPPTSTR